MSSSLSHLISVARGDSPADLVLMNARIINIFNGRIEAGNIAISGERIAGVGGHFKTKTALDLGGKYVAPGLIDGHSHIESSMLDIGEYVRTVVSHGTSAIVTDLHEIANVCGLPGINYILDNARRLPLEIFLMAPSCVPSTKLETNGAVIGLPEIRRLLRRKNCLGLGEVMNYPAVISGELEILAKISMASGKVIDGHAPSLSGQELNAYISGGIQSDHESITLDEAREKLKLGMQIMIREGSSEKNLDALLPLAVEETYRRCCLVVDDRSCADLQRDGGIDGVVRKAIRRGLEPVRAIQLATINTAQYFHISGLGAIAPGFLADLIVIDDLPDLGIDKVYHRGKLVAEEGESLFDPVQCNNESLTHTFHVKSLGLEDLKIPYKDNPYPVIELVPGQIITRRRDLKIDNTEGFILPDLTRDTLKLVVVERHRASGNIGRGLVKGFGLKQGALASSIAHDSHNIIAVGTNDEDILAAIQAIHKMQGGLVAVSGGRTLSELPLPIAGLLSLEPAKIVASKMEKLEQWARKLGSALPAPYAVLSFLALPVIPELRLTDRGLVDVKEFKLLEK